MENYLCQPETLLRFTEDEGQKLHDEILVDVLMGKTTTISRNQAEESN